MTRRTAQMVRSPVARRAPTARSWALTPRCGRRTVERRRPGWLRSQVADPRGSVSANDGSYVTIDRGQRPPGSASRFGQSRVEDLPLDRQVAALQLGRDPGGLPRADAPGIAHIEVSGDPHPVDRDHLGLAVMGRLVQLQDEPTQAVSGPFGVRVAAKEMKEYEARLQRSATLPKYDMIIKPRMT